MLINNLICNFNAVWVFVEMNENQLPASQLARQHWHHHHQHTEGGGANDLYTTRHWYMLGGIREEEDTRNLQHEPALMKVCISSDFTGFRLVGLWNRHFKQLSIRAIKVLCVQSASRWLARLGVSSGPTSWITCSLKGTVLSRNLSM